MPRTPASIDALLSEAVTEAIAKVTPKIVRVISELAAAELDSRLQVAGRVRPASGGRRSRPRAEIAKWVADSHARRVPNFVIEMTSGLDTKKRIVAKYGENAAFEKGKPLPKPKVDTGKVIADGKKPPREAARVVVAK
jgi:hypothetical protein